MEQASTIERQLEQRRRASRRLSTIQHTDKDTQPVATVEVNTVQLVFYTMVNIMTR
jgi:hypothetical protein